MEHDRFPSAPVFAKPIISAASIFVVVHHRGRTIEYKMSRKNFRAADGLYGAVQQSDNFLSC